MIVKTRIIGSNRFVFRFIGCISRFLPRRQGSIPGSFKVFLLHIPVNRQFPELFTAYIHTVCSIQTGFTQKTGTVGFGCLEYNSKAATVYKAMDLIIVTFHGGGKIRHDNRRLLSAPSFGLLFKQTYMGLTNYMNMVQ